MKYGSLPGFNKPISRIIFGCAGLGAAISWVLPVHPRGKLKKSINLLHSAFEAGYNTFDTASVYPGSEYTLGRWIKERKNREEIVLITKGGHPNLITGRARLSMHELQSDLDLSLRRLCIDYIDLYLLHRDDPNLNLDELGNLFRNWKESGKVRAFGVSNWSHQRIEEYLIRAQRNGFPVLSASSPQYSMIGWTRPAHAGCVSIGGKEGRLAREWYAQHDLAIFAWAPFAHGALADSGVISEGVFSSPLNARRIEIAQEIARQRLVPLTQIALSFLLSQPKLNIFPVVGCGSTQTIHANAQSLSLVLTQDELASCEDGVNDLPEAL